jgi:glucose-6-phosphate 1-dehydrogenase
VKEMPTYAAGSWGPREADQLIGQVNGGWRKP